jgi:hypothetical protein
MKIFQTFKVTLPLDVHSEQDSPVFVDWYGVEEIRKPSWGRTLHPVMREDNQLEHIAFLDETSAKTYAFHKSMDTLEDAANAEILELVNKYKRCYTK